MGNLTSQQVNQLANNFLALAEAIGEYRFQKFNSLTNAQNKQLKEFHKRTLDYSDKLYTISATLVIDDVENSLSKLNNITQEIKETYQSLENVQKAINISTSIVTIGASFFSLNPQAIKDSLDNIKNAMLG